MSVVFPDDNDACYHVATTDRDKTRGSRKYFAKKKEKTERKVRGNNGFPPY